MQAAFLGNKRRGNRELLNKIVEQAHLSARGRYDDLSEGKGPLTLNMHWLMRLDILGLEVQNVVLCILECLVPFGSLVVTAIAVYGTGLPTMAVAALFSTHSAAIGIGAFLWTRLARVQPIPRCMGLAGLSQSVLLPLVYAPAQWGAPRRSGARGGRGARRGGGPDLPRLQLLEQAGGDTGIAAARMAVVEPARLALQMGAIALISSLEPDAARLPPTGVQAVFVAFAVVERVVGAFAFYVPLDPKLRLPPVSTAPSSSASIPPSRSSCSATPPPASADSPTSCSRVANARRLLARRVSAFFYAAAAAGFAVALGMCICVVKLHAMARPTLLALAFGTFAPTLLGSLAAASAPRLGPVWTRLLLGLALMLAAVKRIAASQLRVFALPSRWRSVQFSASATMLLQLIEAASPWLLFGLATLFDLDLELRETYSDVLALSFTLLSLPFACAQFVIHIFAARALVRERVVRWLSAPKPVIDDDEVDEADSDDGDDDADAELSAIRVVTETSGDGSVRRSLARRRRQRRHRRRRLGHRGRSGGLWRRRWRERSRRRPRSRRDPRRAVASQSENRVVRVSSDL